MNYGFVVTAAGLNLIASLLAEETLEITSVWVGNGRTDDTSDPVQFTDLISPIALATSTTPVVNNRQAEFVVQYRNDLNGGLATGFFLNEFGVFARKLGDTAPGQLIYYGSLGDYPQWVQPASVGALDVRSYPVSIGLSSDANVSLNYPAVAFLTAEDLQAHNTDPNAHHDLFARMQAQIDRLTALISPERNGVIQLEDGTIVDAVVEQADGTTVPLTIMTTNTILNNGGN